MWNKAKKVTIICCITLYLWEESWLQIWGSPQRDGGFKSRDWLQGWTLLQKFSFLCRFWAPGLSKLGFSTYFHPEFNPQNSKFSILELCSSNVDTIVDQICKPPILIIIYLQLPNYLNVVQTLCLFITMESTKSMCFEHYTIYYTN